MAYIWGVAGGDPAGVPDRDGRLGPGDPGVDEDARRRWPTSGLAALVVYALRARPAWAVVGAASRSCCTRPSSISRAWWGQYESIYLLSALGAVVFAINGHNGPAAALVAVSLMTKPQALPFILPFAAWFWATGGWRELRADRRDRPRRRSSSCGCRSSRPAGPSPTLATSPSTRAGSSPSCRCGPGTPGGWSRSSPAAASSSRTTSRSWGRSRCVPSGTS